MINCPLVSEFKFNNKCSVNVCLYWTPSLPRNCIALDRKETSVNRGNTYINSVEVKFLKKVKNFSSKKTAAIKQVKYHLILYEYISYIYEGVDYKKANEIHVTESIKNLIHNSILSWHNVATNIALIAGSEILYKEFIKKHIKYGKICPTVHTLLNSNNKREFSLAIFQINKQLRELSWITQARTQK